MKLKQLFSFILIAIVFMIGYTLLTEEPKTITDRLADADIKNKEVTYLDCRLKYSHFEVKLNEYGEESLFVYFEFTNNSDKAETFDYKFDVVAFQNGIEADVNYYYDCEEEENTEKEIQPGTTILVAKVFELKNTVDPITIEIRPFVSIDNKKIIDFEIILE
jgi:hypothetical protein